MIGIIKLWLIQNNPQLLAVTENLETICRQVETAAAAGAKLAVFPECALSGFMIDQPSELEQVAQTIPGPATAKIATLCEAHNIYVAFGLLEKRGDRYYNSAVLLGPKHYLFRYAKIHTSSAGADRVVARGDSLVAADTPLGKIGIIVCYDIRFPEATRCLALQGAQLILNISNWPCGAEVNPTLFIRARSAENNIYVAGVNRVGAERGIGYIGRSALVGPDGEYIAKAGKEETILKADIDLTQVKPGLKYLAESDITLTIFADRRPELYGRICQPWP